MGQQRRFQMLLSPFQIKDVKLKNRIVKAPMGMRYAGESDGYVTDKYMGYYESLARGGAGLLLPEGIAVEFPRGASRPFHLRIDDDKFIAGFSKLVQLIKGYGTPCFAQLNHAGPAAKQKYIGAQPVSSSSLSKGELPDPRNDPPRGLTISEIEDIVGCFARAAERAMKAGFDGIEILCGHFYLINSFLSRAWNKRQDAYGGDLPNRARFAIEVIRAVRETVGPNYVVGVRINGAEYGVDGALTLNESKAISQMLEKAGVDYISVSAGGYGDYLYCHWPELVFQPEPPRPLGQGLDGSNRGKGAIVPLAAAIKSVVSVPVMTAGRLNPILAETALRQRKVDLVIFGRPLLADPELPSKLASGQLEDIRPCIGCMRGWEKGSLGEPVTCAVNAALGREREYQIMPAKSRKRVVIIGTGPAGLEAARVAALRGHEVTLYGKEHKLGGAMLLAAVVNEDLGDDLVRLVTYFKIQMNKLGVKIRLGNEVAPAQIEEIKPDVVILAVGGIPVVPEIPGTNRGNVMTASTVHHRLRVAMRFLGPAVLRRLTKIWMPIGKKVIIIGGGIHGCELAVFLTKRGREVTIVETSGELGAGMVWLIRDRTLKWLSMKGCTMLTGVQCVAITPEGLTIATRGEERQNIEADTIITTVGLRPNSELFEALKGKAPEIYVIGDAREPHLIMEAIHDGSRIGRAI